MKYLNVPDRTCLHDQSGKLLNHIDRVVVCHFKLSISCEFYRCIDGDSAAAIAKALASFVYIFFRCLGVDYPLESPVTAK